MSRTGSYSEQLEGTLQGDGVQVALVVSRFNGDISERMMASAVRTLGRHGVKDDHMEIFRVPGAWELPQVAAQLAEQGVVDVIIAIGCVIRGETSHYDIVAGEAARGLMDVALGSGVPVILGLLTTENREQAEERADPDRLDKGAEVALAALEMAALYRSGG
ncbi:MAG: 6,7-dimethyl-8-ribityllumazine synthase [Gemmatimonadales bacterium]|nr:MAG: 6,7-dimethyl-8-ribityllumazine synthase [Gemmatimonadales bacterium]